MRTVEEIVDLDAAKLYLNIPATRTESDDELLGFLPAAVERVDRHVYGEGSTQSLLTADRVTASEVLAVKVVLGEYWRTQRHRVTGRTGGGASGVAIEADSGPGGQASLPTRLAQLLGPPAPDPGKVPVGSFPPPTLWPDPAQAWPAGSIW